MTAISVIRYMLAAAGARYWAACARVDRTRFGRRCLLDPIAIGPLLAVWLVVMPARVVRLSLAAAAPAVRRMCALDVPAMARLRQSETGEARAQAACASATTVGIARAADLDRYLTARLRDALGAPAATSQPRLIGGLVARHAATSAA